MEWRIVTEKPTTGDRVYVSGALTHTQLKRDWKSRAESAEGTRTFIEQKDEGADAKWAEVDSPDELLSK